MQESGSQWIFSSIYHCYKKRLTIVLSCRTLSSIRKWCVDKNGFRREDILQLSEIVDQDQSMRDFYTRLRWAQRSESKANDQTSRSKIVTIKVILLSMFSYFCGSGFVKWRMCHVCVKKKKCQVGEKYLSTGEEKCCKAKWLTKCSKYTFVVLWYICFILPSWNDAFAVSHDPPQKCQGCKTRLWRSGLMTWDTDKGRTSAGAGFSQVKQILTKLWHLYLCVNRFISTNYDRGS